LITSFIKYKKKREKQKNLVFCGLCGDETGKKRLCSLGEW